MTTETKPASLVRKLASVMGACERVPKTGFNKFHNYAYATESDITAGVRSEMAAQGVMMIPTVEAVTWDEVTTGAGKKERLCTVNWLFTLLDADSDAKIEFRNIGQGQDSGDKAFYKAATGAVKYALLKLFLIPTGDDPEEASPTGEVHHGIVAKADATKAAAANEREAARLKLLAGLAAVGIDALTVGTILGHSPVTISNDEWTKLQECGRKAKEALASNPDEASRLAVQAKAEAELAEFDRLTKANAVAAAAETKGSTPQTPVQMAEVLKNSIFAGLVKKAQAAESPEALALVGAEFGASVAAKWTPGDVKAFARASEDRLFVLKDKKRKPRLSDSMDVP